MSADSTKVCALCYFYNETSMDCERFPPSVKTNYVDDNGDNCAYWEQPAIDHPWTTGCGEWKENFDPFAGQSAEAKAAKKRLETIVAQHRKMEKENNADRSGN